MTYGQLFYQLEQELALLGEESEALKIIFRQWKGLTLTDLVLRLREEVLPEDQALIRRIFNQLKAHRPAQYILGSVCFAGLTLKTDERALIPRPETEELMDLILQENQCDRLKVLDLCTGSGAIALALKKNRPSWDLFASDISEEALALAGENAKKHQLDIQLMQSDLFKTISGTFDLIVANPPYISHEDVGEVALNVLKSEPHLALFANENGLAIYRRIIEAAGVFLTSSGKIYFEIGYKQANEVSRMLQQQFPHKCIRVLKDQFRKDRLVVMDDG